MHTKSAVKALLFAGLMATYLFGSKMAAQLPKCQVVNHVCIDNSCAPTGTCNILCHCVN